MSAILSIEGLNLSISNRTLLDGISLSVEAGKIHALVGESGSGKSLTALSAMQLLPHRAVLSGSIRFDGKELVGIGEEEMCALRGDDIAMIFQEPMTALNPVMTIGEQIIEGIQLHRPMDRAEAEKLAAAMVARVGLDKLGDPLARYPHQLSGGQRQRAIIAMACVLQPKLLIADEPTTALDVVLQRQVLDLLRSLVEENNMGLLLISHDLGVVADMADTVTILRNGAVVEQGKTTEVLAKRAHPYTKQLAEAASHVPAWQNRNIDPQEPLLQARDLVKTYPGKRQGLFGKRERKTVVDQVSLTIAKGQMLGLVGQSGCGKSTLARLLLGLEQPDSGTLEIDGKRISPDDPQSLKDMHKTVQIVFQDPYGSFNPRRKVEWLITEPLQVLEPNLGKSERFDRAEFALKEVGLDGDALHRYPHEFSGGQRQRLAIARALITRPRLIIADEPVSALDVSIRAQILDLFAKLNDELEIACLFITHDLYVARAITHETLVMDKGRIVEHGPTEHILTAPSTEIARGLIASAPDLDRALASRTG